MNKLYKYLILISFFVLSCTKEDDKVIVPKEESNPIPTESLFSNDIKLQDVMKFFFTSENLETPTTYVPRGKDFGELKINEKAIAEITLSNPPPLSEAFLSDLRIEEMEPKIFSITESDCGVLHVNASCKFKIKATYSDPDIFSSIKTARLYFGKKDGIPLYIEIFATIKNREMTANEFETNYDIEMDSGFITNYTKFSYQERIIKVKNNSLHRYIRANYLLPKIVGDSPRDFYISQNDCTYPVPAMGYCEMRVIYKKWNLGLEIPDTELEFPAKTTRFSLRHAQVSTYSPTLSDWGPCSKTEVCTGQGTQERSITQCIKNGVDNVSTSQCSAILIQSCNSPAGQHDFPLALPEAGTITRTCDAGSTLWVNHKINCNEDFYPLDSFWTCARDTYMANSVYGEYDIISNPFISPPVYCEGEITSQREAITCLSDYRGINSDQDIPVDKVKCDTFDTQRTITYKSPATPSIGVPRALPTGGGTINQTCAEGSTNWVNTSLITCDEDFYQPLNQLRCDPIVYTPNTTTYIVDNSKIFSSNINENFEVNENLPYADVCSGTGIVSRELTSCGAAHDPTLSFPASKCSDPNSVVFRRSPLGISQEDFSVGGFYAGKITYSCQRGPLPIVGESGPWPAIKTFSSIECESPHFSQNGETCEATVVPDAELLNDENKVNNEDNKKILTRNSITWDGKVYYTGDLRRSSTKLYTDLSCTNEIETQSSTENGLGVVKIMTPIEGDFFQKSFNQNNGASSGCSYSFSLKIDNVNPVFNFNIGNFNQNYTDKEIHVFFHSINEDRIKNAHVFENSNCSNTATSIGPVFNYQIGSTSAEYKFELSNTENGQKDISIILEDYAGNLSACLSKDFYYGVKINNAFTGESKNFFSFSKKTGGTYSACSGTEDNCFRTTEKNEIRVSQRSCDDVFIEDTLGFYDWICEKDSTGIFFTSSFKDDASLIDLYDVGTSSWKKTNINLLNKRRELIMSYDDFEILTNEINKIELSENGVNLCLRPDCSTAAFTAPAGKITVITNSNDDENLNLHFKVSSINVPSNSGLITTEFLSVNSGMNVNLENFSHLEIKVINDLFTQENHYKDASKQIDSLNLTNKNFVSVWGLDITSSKGLLVQNSNYIDIRNHRDAMSNYGIRFVGSNNFNLSNAFYSMPVNESYFSNSKNGNVSRLRYINQDLNSHGILVDSSSSNISIKNSSISGIKGIAVNLQGSNSKFQQNVISASGNGLSVSGNNNEILANTISGINSSGIVLNGSSNTLINVLMDNISGYALTVGGDSNKVGKVMTVGVINAIKNNSSNTISIAENVFLGGEEDPIICDNLGDQSCIGLPAFTEIYTEFPYKKVEIIEDPPSPPSAFSLFLNYIRDIFYGFVSGAKVTHGEDSIIEYRPNVCSFGPNSNCFLTNFELKQSLITESTNKLKFSQSMENNSPIGDICGVEYFEEIGNTGTLLNAINLKGGLCNAGDSCMFLHNYGAYQGSSDSEEYETEDSGNINFSKKSPPISCSSDGIYQMFRHEKSGEVTDPYDLTWPDGY